ncbi:MAG: rod shape-determining protein [Proteobacteria bacterium]|nr:rod shape-determining protein [Pseudomonadota bacterium]
MAYKTVGIDIGAHAVRFVLCQTEMKASIIQSGVIESDGSPEGNDRALEQLAERLVKLKREQIDAIGMCVDPTIVLSTHRMFDFSDPALIDKILPTSVMDIWKNDGSAQLAFEVGEYVDGGDEGDADGEEREKGYDVRVINYPYMALCEKLAPLKRVQIDPHVVLPATEALPYALPGMLDVGDDEVYVILDIGARKTLLSVCEGRSVKLSRALKVGGGTLDSAIAEYFQIPLDDARILKECSGFVAVPGAERAVYERSLQSGEISATEGVDEIALGQACASGLGVLFQGIRQTLMNYLSQRHAEPTHVYLTGGCAQLAGLGDWMSQYMGVPCTVGVPFGIWTEAKDGVTLDACAAALAAAANIEGKCPLNLRRGRLAHKGSLAYLQENKWVLLSCAAILIGAIIFMMVTHAKTVREEHDRLEAALAETTQAVFGKKLLKYNQIDKEIRSSQSYNFIPEYTAFSHFMWLSNNINDNLADVEMDLNSLEIDMQRKIVKIRGEVGGDEGLPRFMQLLEQYECFPDEIPEPRTSKVKDRTSFTLSVNANHCPTGGDNAID